MNKQNNYNYVTATPLSIGYEFHLDDEVTGTEDYRELFEVLRSATENDIVRLSIANFGGNLHTCISIISAIRSSKAFVIGSLTSIAYSAAGVIWLACDHREVFEHASFMGHDASSWIGGTTTQQLKQVQNTKKVVEGLYRDIYTGFLTEEEIEYILNGGDVWLHFDEIVERLEQNEPKPETITLEELSKFTKKELIEIIVKLTKQNA